MWYSTFVLLVLAVLCTVALVVDTRTLRDVSVWAKPLKFNLSLAVYYVTLALLIPLVHQRVRDTVWFRLVLAASVVAGMAEIAWITVQAARGRASHFNFETPFEAAMYSAMGFGAVVLVSVTAFVGVVIIRSPADGYGRTLRAGASAGLVLGSVMTLLVAGYLGSLTDHLAVPSTSDADGLALTGWSRVTGDFRVPHFFATHAMQILPFAGWLLARRNIETMSILTLITFLYGTLVIVLFVQAYTGYPLFAK